ncbi:MAG: hypothetical protein EYC70_14740 [Planctomycetota bacterium]|nr:MAG: hypothetical protein EYC70_14740 [Planctomycetota bacterium]
MKRMLWLTVLGAALAPASWAPAQNQDPYRAADQKVLLQAADLAANALHLAASGDAAGSRAAAAEAAVLLQRYAGVAAPTTMAVRPHREESRGAYGATAPTPQDYSVYVRPEIVDVHADVESLSSLGYVGTAQVAEPVAPLEACPEASANLPECADAPVCVETPSVSVAPRVRMYPGQPAPLLAPRAQAWPAPGMAAQELPPPHVAGAGDTMALLAELQAQVRALRAELAQMRSVLQPPPGAR